MLKKKKANVVGERVRIARQREKPVITQIDLVARLQVAGLDYMDQAKISRIENGERPVYDYEVVAFAHALKAPVAWLLGEENQQREHG